MDKMIIKIDEDITNYITKIECLNKNCKYNLRGSFCNLKNIIVNKNGVCFNIDFKETDNITEKLNRNVV